MPAFGKGTFDIIEAQNAEADASDILQTRIAPPEQLDFYIFRQKFKIC